MSTEAASEQPRRSLSAPSSTVFVAQENDVIRKNISGVLVPTHQESLQKLSGEARQVTRNDDNEDLRGKFELEEKEESISNTDDHFPDGGLAAWLVVFGVSFVLTFSLSPSIETQNFRECVILIARELMLCYFFSLVPLTRS